MIILELLIKSLFLLHSNTALHLCAIHDKAECMKLLLRSGADSSLRNALDKTALDIAKEKGHRTCEELVIKYTVFKELA